MEKYLTFLSLICITYFYQAQITGKVTDNKGEPLPFVNVYIEGSYTGTTTNDDGFYKLDIKEAREVIVVFQFLGYKTKKEMVTPDAGTHLLNVSLEPEAFSLDEVFISSTENPANRIIRNAIENRKRNAEKINEFTADFYSRGLWKVKDVPEKILGQEVG